MNCKCGGEYKEVAFNTDLPDGTELYDYICDKCGKHIIMPIKEIKEDDN